MEKRVLITGAGGFIGSKLLKTLASRGYLVEGPELDVTDLASVTACIKSRQWDVVVHLAALSHVPTCQKNPAETFRVNRDGAILVAEALAVLRPGVHLVFASSAQVYAAPKDREIAEGVVFDETRLISPQNVYAEAKWEAEKAIHGLALAKGIKTTVLRLFNYTHKTQGTEFFLPHLYSLLSKAEPGSKIRIPVGNLEIYRDIGAVADLLSAFEAVIGGRPGASGVDVYNLCGGVRRYLRDLAERLARRFGVDAEFAVDPSRVRPGEAVSVCGSHARLTAATGWSPRFVSDEEFLDSFLMEL